MVLNDYEQLHLDQMRSIAPECTVLLKSNGAFPLSAPGKVALYGSGARKTLKGGTGSGDVNSRFYVTVEEGLEHAGFSVTTKNWLDRYDAVRVEAHKQFVEDIKRRAKKQHTAAIFLGMGAVMPEPAYELPLDGEGDTAIYVVSRICGEGNDRNHTPGDFCLSPTEIRDILACREKYSKFLLVLNVGAVVDLSPVLAVENILMLSQLGTVTGDALADVVLGKANPSGKLTDTWCSSYPTIGDFAEKNETCYKEGVYVGYRYFDSVGDQVIFPFGFGLSYTQFTVEKGAVAAQGRTVTLTARVTNVGSRSGKEVVQLYVTAPWGKLDQPYQVLAGFAKTKELAPGESEDVSICLDLAKIASYDESRSAYILEQGEYLLRIGNSSRNTQVWAKVALDQEVLVRQLEAVGGKPDFTDWKPEHTWGAEQVETQTIQCSAEDFADVSYPAPAQLNPTAMELVKGLSDEALCDLTIGSHKKGFDAASVIGSASQKVAGAAGESCNHVPGVKNLVMADGPAGLRLSQMYTQNKKGVHSVGSALPDGMIEFMPAIVAKLMSMGSKKPKGVVRYQYCTAIPIGTAIAQSWNPEVARRCGDVVGKEMEIFNVDLWLAPAFNIHRNPLCGRNFEYYSEDPLLSGIMGAAITQGVQKHPGRSVTIKHFCCNNQETNRYQSNSQVSERALREIYMKPFEICIALGNPRSIMTSYNLLNGTHTAEHSDLLKNVVRGEWGWTGLIMTDWIITAMQDKGSTHRITHAAPAIQAGNDLFMPGSSANYKDVLTALNGTNPNYRLTREEVEFCAAHLVALIMELKPEG